jgi:hypothetical protein
MARLKDTIPTTTKDDLFMETGAPSQEEVLQTKKAEVLTRPELETGELVKKLKEKFDIPPIPPLTWAQKLAGWATTQILNYKIIGRPQTQDALHLASKLISGVPHQEFPKDTSPPYMRDSNSAWAINSGLNLNGNENRYNLPPSELATLRLTTRFNVVVPIEKPLPNIDIQQQLFETLHDNTNAMRWEAPGGGYEYSYKLKIEKPDDIYVIDLNDAALVNLQVSDIKGKVIYLQNEADGNNSPEYNQKIQELLNNNKFIIREVHEEEGTILQAIVNHNWGDARPIELAMCQFANKVSAIRPIDDDQKLQGVLDRANNRYNFGENNADGAIHSFVLEKELVEEIDRLYLAYKDAIPTVEKLRELFSGVKGYDEDTIKDLQQELDRGITKARVTQLFVQQALGCDAKNIYGGMLLFRPRSDEELDEFKTECTLDDIKVILEAIDSNNKGRARGAVRELLAMLDFYDKGPKTDKGTDIGKDETDKKQKKDKIGKRKSNIQGKTGHFIAQMPGWDARYRMAQAASYSGASASHSGQVLTTYGHERYTPQKWEQGAGGQQTHSADTQVHAFTSSAHPKSMDASASIVVAHKEGAVSRDSKYERIVISIKANWSQRQKQ